MIGALLLVALASAAYAQRPPPDASTDLTRITDLIGEAKCASDDQCRTIGIGALSCGGPESYLPWSVSATDETALRDTAVRYAQARRKRDESMGAFSPCVIQPEPGVHCERSRADTPGRCVLIPATAGRPPIR
jgi:hypothetical protein